MSCKVRDVEIKNRTYCFFRDMIITKNFDPKIINLDENSCKNIVILLYWIYKNQRFNASSY